ncbi:MAG: hypothetical protein U0R26_09105 [Solirubrobacterales bacterium]
MRSKAGGSAGFPHHRHREQVRERQLIGVDGERQATSGQLLGDLHLVIVDGLAVHLQPGRQHRTLADLQSRERRPDTGVRHDDVGLAHRLAQLPFGHRVKTLDPERGDVGGTRLPEHLGLGGRISSSRRTSRRNGVPL